MIELQDPARTATKGVPAGTPLLIYEGYYGSVIPYIRTTIDKLVNDKNSIIADKKYATDALKQIGYFALIGGYKELFKNPTTQKYKDGTNFEDKIILEY